MDRKTAEEIANFRYRLISPIVCKETLYYGGVAQLIREAADKTYQIPGSRKTRVSPRTIERYLKLYREGGYESLMPNYSTSKPSRIPSEFLEAAAALKCENLKRPIEQIIETLELSGRVPKGILKRSTVYDHFKRLGLTKELGKKESGRYQRFSPKHRNQRWQGDTCHLLHILHPENPKRKLKVYLIAWLDEYSRIIPHAQCYTEEKSYTLEDSLKKAMMKYGVPEQIYVDNGKVYSSHQLQRVCGRLGIHLSHTRPYRPQGRGKLERFFLTIQRSFLPELELLQRDKPLMSIDEVNDYLFVWLRQHYHERVHSATKQNPMLRFESDTHPLQKVSLETLNDAFLLEETRLVDKTGVFQLNRVQYQAPLALAKRRVLVRYDPFDPTFTQLYHNDQRYADAYPLEIPEQVNPQVAAAAEKEELAASTKLNFLNELIKHKRQGLSYSDLNK